jgi:hypothetical protein
MEAGQDRAEACAREGLTKEKGRGTDTIAEGEG